MTEVRASMSTTYKVLVTVEGRTIVLPMRTRRKTISGLVRAVFDHRDLVLDHVPAADLAEDSRSENGALRLGRALVHYSVA